MGARNLFDDNHPEGALASFTDAELLRVVYAELRLRVKQGSSIHRTRGEHHLKG